MGKHAFFMGPVDQAAIDDVFVSKAPRTRNSAPITCHLSPDRFETGRAITCIDITKGMIIDMMKSGKIIRQPGSGATPDFNIAGIGFCRAWAMALRAHARPSGSENGSPRYRSIDRPRRVVARAAGMTSVMASLWCGTPASAATFDFDTGNAAVAVVAVTGTPVLAERVSATAGDASLVLRYGTLVTNAWYDATAPYHPTAVGVYSRLGRRPASESTNRNINIAVLYASYRLLSSFLPTYRQTWRDMLIGVGLDPDDQSTDITTPIGLGNVAGHAVAVGRRNDGMNELGNEGREYNPRPYSDYTGYKPVNTAHVLVDPSRWQPGNAHGPQSCDVQRQDKLQPIELVQKPLAQKRIGMTLLDS